MKLKALSILSLVGLFAAGSLMSGSVIAKDYKNNNRNNNSSVTKRVVIKETPHSTKRIVTTYRNTDSKKVRNSKSHRVDQKKVVVKKQPAKRGHSNYRTNHNVKYRTGHSVSQNKNYRKNHVKNHSNDLGLLVGGIVLGSILVNH